MKNLLLFFVSIFLFSNVYSQLDFVNQIGGGNDHTFYCIATDFNGDIIVAGRFAGTSDFDPGTSTSTMTSSNGSFDLCIAKYTAAGDLIWAKSAGDVYEDAIKSIYVDATGNIFATGQFSGTVDFDFGTGTNNLITDAPNSYEQFIIKVDPNGTVLMAKQIGINSTGDAYGLGISLDGNGNIFTTGNFIGTVDFDPHVTNSFPLSAIGGNFDMDIFVSKLDANGDFVWAVRAGGNSFTPEMGRAIAIDPNENIYVVGDFGSTVDFNPGAGTANLISNGNSDSFIWKLSNDGNLIHASNFGSVANDFVTSIDVDDNAYLYISGYFVMTCDFDLGNGTQTLNAGNTNYDGYLYKIDSAFAYQWAKQIDGSTANIMVHDIIADANGDVIATGRLQGTADFDPGAGTLTLASSNIKEFIIKLDGNGDLICAIQVESTGSAEALSVTLDGNSHFITCGSFANTIDFNPSTSIDNLTSTSTPGGDGYFKKVFCPINTTEISETENEMVIYPNPTNGNFTINLGNENQALVSVFSITGNLIYNGMIQNNASLNLSHFANGIYQVNILSSEKQMNKRIIIEK